MKLVVAAILAICGLALVGSASLEAKYPSYIHRIQVVVEIADGTQVHSGAGVLEVTWQRQPLGPGWNCTLRGDAISIEMGPQVAVAILTQIEEVRPDFCHTAILAYGLGRELINAQP